MKLIYIVNLPKTPQRVNFTISMRLIISTSACASNRLGADVSAGRPREIATGITWRSAATTDIDRVKSSNRLKY